MFSLLKSYFPVHWINVNIKIWVLVRLNQVFLLLYAKRRKNGKVQLGTLVGNVWHNLKATFHLAGTVSKWN